MTFDSLGLAAPILRAVSDTGYTTPTPIQLAAIPPALAGRDVLGCAQTGTGKTAAFSLPLLQRVDAVAGDKAILRALVLTPTRELAIQIGDSIETYGKDLDLDHTVIFGGVNEKPQIEEMRRGVDVLVATPGRLLDLMQQGHVRLDTVEIFVLDEADRMLDMGFLPDVKRVIAKLPKKRQTLFFSATMPPDIRELANTLLVDPVSVAVAPPATTADRIEQQLYFVDKGNKSRLLIELLRDPAMKYTLVFTRTKHGANRVVEHLTKAGLKAAAIHGNKSQNARERAMNGFRSGELRLLVATDIAARGIDVDGLTHVVNFDLPNVPETYVHRIGRTGRAGAAGIALSFCDDEEREFLVDIERLIGKHVPRVERHSFMSSAPPPPFTDLARRGHAPRPSGGGNGGRPPQHGGRHPGAGPRVEGPHRSHGHGGGGHGGGRQREDGAAPEAQGAAPGARSGRRRGGRGRSKGGPRQGGPGPAPR